MAGERLAKLTIQASFSSQAALRGNQTQHVAFTLAGLARDYYRGAYTQFNQYVVPDPVDVGRDYVKQAVDNLLSLLRLSVQAASLPYTVSVSRDMGNDLLTNQPKIEFDIEATLYDNQLNLSFQDFFGGQPKGWTVLQNLPTLQPITVAQLITPAGAYGSATGSIQLLATAGNRAPFTYVWNDGVTGSSRQQLVAGTYTCVVKDQDGVSTTVTCVVKSDARLTVAVQQTETSLTLTVSGGLAPYTVQWDDGPTGFTRSGLAQGTYYATVTDDRGATQRVVVTLVPNRCYFSHNPILLPLDAGPNYRLYPTNKPNLSFLCEVWVEPDYLSGVYVQAGPTLEQPADPQGRTVFDAQALLDAYVREHLPPQDGRLVERAEVAFKRFYLKSAEKYGTPPVPAALSTAQVNFVVCGGLSEEEAAAGNWPQYQARVQPFLTWEPDYQRVLSQQPVYLYYQHVAAPCDVLVWLRVRHADGSTSAGNIAGFTAARWEIYSLGVGPAQQGLTTPDVVGYDIYVTTGQQVPLSEVRHFVLERAFYPNPRYFVYSNSLGGANVLTALGAAKQTLEVKAEQAPRPAYDPALGDVATLDRVGTPTVSVATGPRKRAQVQADQELLLSRRVCLLRAERYWPGTVTAAAFLILDEAEGLASLAFDFVLPRQRHFTPLLPAPIVGLPAGGVAAATGGGTP